LDPHLHYHRSNFSNYQRIYQEIRSSYEFLEFTPITFIHI
jgi:hypothetical protein